MILLIMPYGSNRRLQDDDVFMVGESYLVMKKLGRGAFGNVYCVRDLLTDEKLAVKIENDSAENHHPKMLLNEYRALDRLKGIDGIPSVHWFDETRSPKSLVLDMLGPSLGELFHLCKDRFSLKTVLMLADQMIGLMEKIHDEGIIHRDLKPENFLMGFGPNCSKVYLIDFGLAGTYQDPATGKHLPCGWRPPAGTLRFAPRNAHRELGLTRRDDMESLGFLLLFFLRGELPWQHVTVRDKKQRLKMVGQIKLGTSMESLCAGYPDEFGLYVVHCENLEYDERPDYGYLRGSFQKLYEKSYHAKNFDFLFDWVVRGRGHG